MLHSLLQNTWRYCVRNRKKQLFSIKVKSMKYGLNREGLPHIVWGYFVLMLWHSSFLKRLPHIVWGYFAGYSIKKEPSVGLPHNTWGCFENLQLYDTVYVCPTLRGGISFTTAVQICIDGIASLMWGHFVFSHELDHSIKGEYFHEKDITFKCIMG